MTLEEGLGTDGSRVVSAGRLGEGNEGVVIAGSGPVTMIGNAIGKNARVVAAQAPGAETPHRDWQWDLGVITILSEETRAVTDLLRRSASYREQVEPNGLRFEEADIDAAGRFLKVVATQSLGRGSQSTGHAFGNLLQQYVPIVVVLTGIAGGIHPDVALGDVVIGEEIICYDQRKETPAEVRRRGTSYLVPPTIRRAINRFFSVHGDPCRLTVVSADRTQRTFKVHHGPIGSGDAVIADAESEIRSYLRAFNDKILAVETEAGGLGQAFYEQVDEQAGASGWLVIRGICDLAAVEKDDAYHDVASWHAVAVLERLAPYLRPVAGP